MSKKHSVVFGILATVLWGTNAFSNPASTEYVKSSIDALRTELNNQSSARFNELSTATNQLTTKTNELTTMLNQLSLQLNQFITQMNDRNTGANNKIEEVQKQVNELPIITHQIGEMFQGGMVFYVDSSQQHGLMVSLGDIGDAVEWRNGEGGDRITNAHAQGLGSGETNTRLIIAEQTIDQQEGQFAALAAANYQISSDGKSPGPTTMNVTFTCHGGWYLPSIYELVLLNSTLKHLGLGEIKDELYWSSTESDTTQAWLVDFANGEPQARDKATAAHIRAIHSF
jgi:hypothetical protein